MLNAVFQHRFFSQNNLAGDFWGGLAAMLVALPAAIAFGVTIFAPLGGSLAAQGALAGILGTVALGLITPLFGGSTRLITAPCAPAAAVLAALAVGLSQQNMSAENVLILLALVTLLTGLIQIMLGLFGIGRLIRFIPYPVVSGYLSAVGLIIIGSQIPKLLGAASGVHLVQALLAPTLWLWQPILIGAVVIATMVLIPKLTRAVPATILALLAGVACYLALAQLDPKLMQTQHNPLLVGALTQADAGFVQNMLAEWHALSLLSLDTVVTVLLPALTLAALLSIDTLKTCVIVDAMTNTHHDSNRELIGQGLGNMLASAIGGIPGAGTMGASLINVYSGGTTPRAGFMVGALSLLVLLLLAPLIAWVPVSALAAILIVIGFRMIDRNSIAFFFTPATRLDFMVIMAVILVAIFGNLIAASGVGVALAMMLFIREQTRSSVVRNRIEGREIFLKHAYKLQDMERLIAKADESVVFELQGSLFFGTASQLQHVLEKEIGKRRYIILSMRRVQSIDVTATHMLEQIKDQLEQHDGYLIFCDIPKGLPSGLKMKRYLKDTGVVLPTNKAFAFRQLDDAMEWVMTAGDSAALNENTAIAELTEALMFMGQSAAAMQAMQEAVTLRNISAGETLFKAGEDDDELLLMRTGLVKVSLPISKKDSYHLVNCGPGEFIGGTGFLEGGGHATEAIAINDVEVYVLSRKQFNLLAKAYPALTLAIIENVALNLSVRLRVTISELQALRG